jgi:hypothetical protein
MKIFRHWRIIYAVCCIIYVGWVIHVGGNEFDRINSQYRNLVVQLDGNKINAVAVEELVTECSRAAKDRLDLQEDDCSSWPPHVVEARAKMIEERLFQARKRGRIKLVLFYTGFVLIFLLGPPLIIYLLLVAVIKVWKSIKIVKG